MDFSKFIVHVVAQAEHEKWHVGKKIAWSFARQWHFSVFQGVTTIHDNIILIANSV